MFQDASYARHSNEFAADLVDPDRKRIAASWFDETTANAWRDLRGYEIAEHLGAANETWVTIGDGRYGLDSIRLRNRGAGNALPTNLDTALLQDAKNRRIISDFSEENAERLSFADKSFDYAFCKEAYHHFPRPMIALYEMLRISRKGVILVEPNDRQNSMLRKLAEPLKRALGRGPAIEAANYEDSGNYVFSISPREIEKVALGLNIPQVAYKGLNDAYVVGMEFEKADFLKSRSYRKLRRTVAMRDLLCRVGLDEPMVLMACIFHVPVSADQRRTMQQSGWKIVDLPRNPHISA
jgi:SAM-dependent methyltransferase